MLDNEFQWALKPADCHKRAKKLQESGSCNFFMHSEDYPSLGCSCCDTYEPVADAKNNYSVF
jgi:hypothetical protein